MCLENSTAIGLSDTGRYSYRMVAREMPSEFPGLGVKIENSTVFSKFRLESRNKIGAELLTSIRIAFGLLTRIPVGELGNSPSGGIGRSTPYFPIVGLFVGGIGAGVLFGSTAINLPPAISAGLAILALILATGAIHEDGLADSADGLGLNRPAARTLEIMRDSRIGVFGVIAIAASLGLRWAALTAIVAVSVEQGALILIAAAVTSRALMPVIMKIMSPARTNGLAHDAGQPQTIQVAAGIFITAVILWAGLEIGLALLSTGIAAIAVTCFCLFVHRRIGGQTGDVLGASQQIAEISIPLVSVAYLGWQT